MATPTERLERRIERLERRARVTEDYIRGQMRVIPGGGARADMYAKELEDANEPPVPAKT